MSPIPSSFLPRLPRSQTSLSPLFPTDVLAHIAVLKDLYLPPVQGGFTAQDFTLSEPEPVAAASASVGLGPDGASARRRTLSGGSVDLVPPTGLGLEGLSVSDIAEADEDEDGDNIKDGRHHPTSSTTSSSAQAISIPAPFQAPAQIHQSNADEDQDEDEDEDDREPPHLDPFEREWAEKWLGGVVRRVQGDIEERLEQGDKGGVGGVGEVEAVLREATAVLAMMAGMSAAGSVTRHLLFPITPSLIPALFSRSSALSIPINPALSPETTNFLTCLSTSPVSPTASFRPLHRSTSPTTSTSSLRGSSRRRGSSSSPHAPTVQSSHGAPVSPKKKSRRPAAVPVLLHDAPMSDQDHLGVGMQTWGSAILLGREMALRPSDFGLFPSDFVNDAGTPTISAPSASQPARPTRVLELGAGTGLLSILCRKLLDLYDTSLSLSSPTSPRSSQTWGQVVATDFLPSVLDNLKICIDLNFPPTINDDGFTSSQSSVDVAKLDWVTFHRYMEWRDAGSQAGQWDGEEEELGKYLEKDGAFDLVLASDCVYDMTHAELLRKVASWVLRLPDPAIPSDIGGTFHLLSPLRPTFAPELESIDANFIPHTSLPPLPEDRMGLGEGLGKARGLRIGVRGEGKRSVQGRRGEGRSDEVGGYWWWEVGWA